jgi:hypothetical protein
MSFALDFQSQSRETDHDDDCSKWTQSLSEQLVISFIAFPEAINHHESWAYHT